MGKRKLVKGRGRGRFGNHRPIRKRKKTDEEEEADSGRWIGYGDLARRILGRMRTRHISACGLSMQSQFGALTKAQLDLGIMAPEWVRFFAKLAGEPSTKDFVGVLFTAGGAGTDPETPSGLTHLPDRGWRGCLYTFSTAVAGVEWLRMTWPAAQLLGQLGVSRAVYFGETGRTNRERGSGMYSAYIRSIEAARGGVSVQEAPAGWVAPAPAIPLGRSMGARCPVPLARLSPVNRSSGTSTSRATPGSCSPRGQRLGQRPRTSSRGWPQRYIDFAICRLHMRAPPPHTCACFHISHRLPPPPVRASHRPCSWQSSPRSGCGRSARN